LLLIMLIHLKDTYFNFEVSYCFTFNSTTKKSTNYIFFKFLTFIILFYFLIKMHFIYQI